MMTNAVTKTTAELIKRLQELEAQPPTAEVLAEGHVVYEELKRRAARGDRDARRATDYGL